MLQSKQCAYLTLKPCNCFMFFLGSGALGAKQFFDGKKWSAGSLGVLREVDAAKGSGAKHPLDAIASLKQRALWERRSTSSGNGVHI